MRSSAFRIALLLMLFCTGTSSLVYDEGGANIEGTVYDLYEAVIGGVHISVQNYATGETTSVFTDDTGLYRAKVQPGRYKVSMHPSAGYPIGYEHASFSVSSGERVMINFRPKPVSISDSIKSGRWIEKYEGVFPSHAVHFMQQANGGIRDLRIQYNQLKTRNSAIEYKLSVVASFDRFTLYANKVLFDSKKGTLIAEGNVLLEDGERVRKVRKAEINLLGRSLRVISAP